MTNQSYTPATRADLVPGAVFVMRKPSMRDHELGFMEGVELVLCHDDGTEAPEFVIKNNPSKYRWINLLKLERLDHPITIPVPRDAARDFVWSHYPDGAGSTLKRCYNIRSILRAALLTADPTLADEPAARVEPLPAMTVELLTTLRAWHAAVLQKIIADPDWVMRQPTRHLHAAIKRAGIVQPRPTDDEIAAARQVIERAGMKVTS